MIYTAFTSDSNIPLAMGTLLVASCEDDRTVRANFVNRRMQALIAQEKNGGLRNVQLYEAETHIHGKQVEFGRWKGMVYHYTIYYDVAIGDLADCEWKTTREDWYFSFSDFERDQWGLIFAD